MFETQTADTRKDELNRCRDRSWLSIEEENRFGETNPVNLQEPAGTGSETQASRFQEPIHTGQKVFLSGDKFIGQVTKLFTNSKGEISHLAVQTARLFGRHKLVPISVVENVLPIGVLLTISRDQFVELPGFKVDSILAEEVDQALWDDIVLRSTDYRQIDTQVRDGIVILNGHVTTGMIEWRAEAAVMNIPGILGMNSYLIPDDKLAFEVAEIAGRYEQVEDRKLYTKVENGFVVLSGVVSSLFIRDEIEQLTAQIPWVRGIINEINVPGETLKSEDLRVLQPLIGKELIFKDAVSTTVRKVVINPHNRRVVAVVVLGRFPSLSQDPVLDYAEPRQPERLVVLPVHLILHLTSSAGFLRINSDAITEYEVFDPSGYFTPGTGWLPPYPYCTDEVLFLAHPQTDPLPDSAAENGIKPDSTETSDQMEKATQEAIGRFDNEGGRSPGG